MRRAVLGLSRGEIALVLGLVAGFVLAVSATLVTADRWIVLHRLQIEDTTPARPPAIAYDREILRDFYGEWLVEVWSLSRGQELAECSEPGQHNYTAHVPPPARDLLWLLGGSDRCLPRQPGEYFVRVYITINPGSVMERKASIQSNVFAVR